ncbi:hypothetical protein B0H17DRAFT_1254759 [Mycena rosella]|uniref:Uncharacterized protein n=1 Tax=Mycena rosella TaxID=1033263 RepID=A0AAD7G443_MYCRO|nr:hypothetical protein B0H17DRAFT_1254759 [Mycena rosella]
MIWCLALPFAVVFIGYIIAHAIVASILEHAILAIAKPNTYLATLRSSVFAPLYGTPIVIAAVVILTAFLVGVVCLISSEVEGKVSLALLDAILPIPAGAVIQILGVILLKAHGFHGPFLSIMEAARIGAVGHTVLIRVHGWRFNRSGAAT